LSRLQPPARRAEELWCGSVLYQGTTLELSRELASPTVLYQGTTLVVPQDAENTSGFSPWEFLQNENDFFSNLFSRRHRRIGADTPFS